MTPLAPTRRVAIVAVAAAINVAVYLALNHRPPAPPTWRTPLDDVVPFLPWTMWPYCALLPLGLVAALFITEREAFVTTVRAYAIAFCANFTFWLAHPTSMPRPPLPDTSEVTRALYEAFTAVDTANNACPSGHLTVPVVVCWGLARQRPRWRAPLALLVAALAPTVLTTRQHTTVDLAAGVATGLIGIAIATLWARTRRS